MALSHPQTQPPVPSAFSGNLVVVVWEWQDSGLWLPYDAHVSNFIEHHYQKQSPNVVLASIDVSLSHYVVDLSADVQIRQDTGNKRMIRRMTYPDDSLAGRNIFWQWASDRANQWCNYGIEVAQILEDAFCQNHQIVDLSQTVYRLPYTVDFHKKQQIRKQTGFARQIRRVQQGATYVKINHGAQGQTPSYSSSSANAFPTGATAFSNAFAMAGPSFSQLPQNYNSLVAKSKHNAKATYRHSSPHIMTRSQLRSLAAQASNTVSPQSTAPPATHMNGGHIALLPDTSGSFAMQHPTSNFNQPLNTSLHSNKGTNMRGKRLSPAMSGITNMLISPAVQITVPTGQSSQADLPNHAMFQLQEQQESDKNPEEALLRFANEVSNPSKDEDCCICFDNLQEESSYADDASNPADKCVVWKLNKCEHMFHKLCILSMYKSGSKGDGLQCPACKAIYGEKLGNCPAGHMEYHMMSNSLPGHSDCGTIRITYTIYPGIQGPNHPNPGQPYRTYGFPRVGYLPNNEMGKKILRLLIKAWNRRLIFTIGTSATTGMQNAVIWNEIHHKTEFGANISGHGYPDPKYFDNVLLELASQGVTED